MAYESPIELITNNMITDINTQAENAIFKAVQNVGVNVDKAELLRALKYDRDQYNKGFNDGIREGYKLAQNDLLNDYFNTRF